MTAPTSRTIGALLSPCGWAQSGRHHIESSPGPQPNRRAPGHVVSVISSGIAHSQTPHLPSLAQSWRNSTQCQGGGEQISCRDRHLRYKVGAETQNWSCSAVLQICPRGFISIHRTMLRLWSAEDRSSDPRLAVSCVFSQIVPI